MGYVVGGIDLNTGVNIGLSVIMAVLTFLIWLLTKSSSRSIDQTRDVLIDMQDYYTKPSVDFAPDTHLSNQLAIDDAYSDTVYICNSSPGPIIADLPSLSVRLVPKGSFTDAEKYIEIDEVFQPIADGDHMTRRVKWKVAGIIESGFRIRFLDKNIKIPAPLAFEFSLSYMYQGQTYQVKHTFKYTLYKSKSDFHQHDDTRDG